MQKTMLLAVLLLFTITPSAEARPDCPDSRPIFAPGFPTNPYVFWANDSACFTYNTAPMPAESTIDAVHEYGVDVGQWSLARAECFPNTAPLLWATCYTSPPQPPLW